MTPDNGVSAHKERGFSFPASILRDQALLVDNKWILRFSRVIGVTDERGMRVHPFVKLLTPSDYSVALLTEAGPRILNTNFRDGIGTTRFHLLPNVQGLTFGNYSVDTRFEFTPDGTKLDLNVHSDNHTGGHAVVSGVKTRELSEGLRLILRSSQ